VVHLPGTAYWRLVQDIQYVQFSVTGRALVHVSLNLRFETNTYLFNRRYIYIQNVAEYRQSQ